MDDQCFAALDLEGVVDTLLGSEGDGRDGTGMQQVQAIGQARGMRCRYRDIVGVKAAFRIVVAIGIDAIADAEPAHARPGGDDRAGTIDAQDQRHALGLAARRAVAKGSVPAADARRIERDQHFLGARLRHRDLADGEHFGPAETIDSCGAHGLRDRAGAHRSLLSLAVFHGRLQGMETPEASNVPESVLQPQIPT